MNAEGSFVNMPKMIQNLVPTDNCVNQPVVYRAFKSKSKSRQFLLVVTGSVAKYSAFHFYVNVSLL